MFLHTVKEAFRPNIETETRGDYVEAGTIIRVDYFAALETGLNVRTGRDSTSMKI